MTTPPPYQTWRVINSNILRKASGEHFSRLGYQAGSMEAGWTNHLWMGPMLHAKVKEKSTVADEVNA